MKLFLFFAFLSSTLLWSQQDLNGKITIDDYYGKTQNVLIENLTQNTQTISSDYNFTLQVDIDDILKFTSAVTEDREIVISKDIYDKKYVHIHINRYIVYLRDTKALNLSGYLGEDVNSVKEDEFKNLIASLDVKITAWDMLQMKKESLMQPMNMNGEMNSQIDFISMAGLLIALLKSKKPVPLKTTVSEKTKTNEEIKSYLGFDYFTEELNIPFIEIDFFLQYVILKEQNFHRKNYLDILKILSEQAENYTKRDKSILIEK